MKTMNRSLLSVMCLVCFVMCGCDAAKEITVTDGNRKLSSVIKKGNDKLGEQHIKMLEDDIEGLKALIAESRKESAAAVVAANKAFEKAVKEEVARLEAIDKIIDKVIPKEISWAVGPVKDFAKNKIEGLDTMLKSVANDMGKNTEKIVEMDKGTVESSKDIEDLSGDLEVAVSNAKEIGVKLDNRTKEGIGGLLVATSAGGLFGKFGKSRGAAKTEKLTVAVSEIKERVDLATEPASKTARKPAK